MGAGSAGAPRSGSPRQGPTSWWRTSTARSAEGVASEAAARFPGRARRRRGGRPRRRQPRRAVPPGGARVRRSGFAVLHRRRAAALRADHRDPPRGLAAPARGPLPRRGRGDRAGRGGDAAPGARRVDRGLGVEGGAGAGQGRGGLRREQGGAAPGTAGRGGRAWPRRHPGERHQRRPGGHAAVPQVRRRARREPGGDGRGAAGDLSAAEPDGQRAHSRRRPLPTWPCCWRATSSGSRLGTSSRWMAGCRRHSPGEVRATCPRVLPPTSAGPEPAERPRRHQPVQQPVEYLLRATTHGFPIQMDAGTWPAP